jgi:hypothetical protein
MTPEELNNALQSAALTYVREIKQQDVPLRVNQELAVDIIRTKQYQHRDEISLILEARGYIKERLPVKERPPVHDRAQQSPSCCGGMLCRRHEARGGDIGES